MKIFILEGDHPEVPGHIRKCFATRALANIEAAEITNLLRGEYEDINGETMSKDATADDWEAKLLEYRQKVADDVGVDLDTLDDDDAGDVWITEEELIGFPLSSALNEGTGDETSSSPVGWLGAAILEKNGVDR